jgi:hypothetical protein
VKRLCGFHLFHGLGFVLVSWIGPGFSDYVRDGVPCPRRYFNAAGLVDALDRFIGFRDVDTAELAHDNLSSVLRCRRHLRQVRAGTNVDGRCAISIQAPRCVQLGSY